MKTLSILSARMLARALSLIKRGGSLPGQIALRIDPDVPSKLKYEGIVILVTGTNGKTDTSNMIADLMMHAGKTVISNRRGDNMRAGVATAILTHCSLSGKVRGNALVLEVDELNVRHLLPQAAGKRHGRDQLLSRSAPTGPEEMPAASSPNRSNMRAWIVRPAKRWCCRCQMIPVSLRLRGMTMRQTLPCILSA